MLRLHLNTVFQGEVLSDLITCQMRLCEISCRAFSSLSLTICESKNKASIPINYAGIEKNHRHSFGAFVVQVEFLFLPQKHTKLVSLFISLFLFFFYCLFASKYLIIFFSNMSYISPVFWVCFFFLQSF